MMREDTWELRGSRLPAMVCSLFLIACGAAVLTVGEGLPRWIAMASAAIGSGLLVHTLHRPCTRLRLTIGERVRLESATGEVVGEGLVDGASLVIPGLIALRLRHESGRRCTDLLLDTSAAPADDLRRLRVRLLNDTGLRA